MIGGDAAETKFQVWSGSRRTTGLRRQNYRSSHFPKPHQHVKVTICYLRNWNKTHFLASNLLVIVTFRLPSKILLLSQSQYHSYRVWWLNKRFNWRIHIMVLHSKINVYNWFYQVIAIQNLQVTLLILFSLYTSTGISRGRKPNGNDLNG